MPTKNIATRKQELSQEAERYRLNIETQVTEYKQDAVKIAKNALIIGGACLAVYSVVRVLTSDKEPKQKIKKTSAETTLVVAPEEKEDSAVWSTLKGVALSIALSLVRQKLVDAIATLTATDEAERN